MAIKPTFRVGDRVVYDTQYNWPGEVISIDRTADGIRYRVRCGQLTVRARENELRAGDRVVFVSAARLMAAKSWATRRDE